MSNVIRKMSSLLTALIVVVSMTACECNKDNSFRGKLAQGEITNDSFTVQLTTTNGPGNLADYIFVVKSVQSFIDQDYKTKGNLNQPDEQINIADIEANNKIVKELVNVARLEEHKPVSIKVDLSKSLAKATKVQSAKFEVAIRLKDNEDKDEATGMMEWKKK
jgi:hypothetical protein